MGHKETNQTNKNKPSIDTVYPPKFFLSNQKEESISELRVNVIPLKQLITESENLIP